MLIARRLLMSIKRTMRLAEQTTNVLCVCQMIFGYLVLGPFGQLWGGQAAIREELDRVDWQPTWAQAGTEYVGREVCVQCHAEISAMQQSSAMAHALATPAESLVFETHPKLTFSQAPYHYTVEQRGANLLYEVTDGRDTISVPVAWAFGQGKDEVGQTYLFSYRGSYYEGRVTFYNSIQGLDITLGHSPVAPNSLEGALGRRLDTQEVRACLGCHSTGAVRDGRLQPQRAVPGITCEGCHGSGAAHVAAMKSRKWSETHVFNPGTLKPRLLLKFCGACHRTASQVKAVAAKGVATVRFQPYRLSETRCFDPDDRRISCLACHDPHQNPRREPAYYDDKCVACHNRGKVEGSKAVRIVCPVARSRCTSCHMPKYSLPGSHFKFTDHRIRVVRLGDRFE
jgi:hypothetical protein